MSWSVDADSYDWKKISASHMLNHTLSELEKRRGGILLMHDVQAKTAVMLPTLLSELKARGYRIVHVVPQGGSAPDLVASAPPRPKAQPLPLITSGHSASRAPSARQEIEPLPPEPPVARGPGGNGLFEAIFTSSAPRWGR